MIDTSQKMFELLTCPLHSKVSFHSTPTLSSNSIFSIRASKSEEGRDAAPFDVKLDGKRMDLASEEGFCNAMWSVANLRPGSGHLSAPVCSTFVIVYFGH